MIVKTCIHTLRYVCYWKTCEKKSCENSQSPRRSIKTEKYKNLKNITRRGWSTSIQKHNREKNDSIIGDPSINHFFSLLISRYEVLLLFGTIPAWRSSFRHRYLCIIYECVRTVYGRYLLYRVNLTGAITLIYWSLYTINSILSNPSYFSHYFLYYYTLS